MIKPLKIAFHTLGCRLNQAETASLENRFAAAGFKIVEFDEPADVVVINTCTVTDHGDSDTRRLVNRLHRRDRDTRIALIGCQSQVQGEQLVQLPGVHWVIGNAVKMDLPEIIRSHTGPGPLILAPEIGREAFTVPGVAIDRHHTRANLKIQDGCNFMCAFCEIPYARGRSRSREFSDLVREADALAQAGHRELVLTGINIGTYRDGEKNIVDVIAALERIDALARIRISSIEMTTVPNEIFSFMKNGKLCRFLHVPAQSGSDPILKAMHRRHRAGDFAELIHRAAATVADICLGTDVMVGFPGETQRHFEETCLLLEELPLAYFHVFSYSDRKHSKSRLMDDKIPEEVKAERSRRLRTLSEKKRHAYFQRFIKRTEAVLFEQQKNSVWSGFTDTYIRVRVPSEEALHNQIRQVQLLRADQNSMSGKLP